MYTPLRLLGSIAIPSSFLLACISSAGIGALPGASGDAGVGGTPSNVGANSTAGTSTTGPATGGTSWVPNTTSSSTGGAHATGGAPDVATGGSPGVATGGTNGAGTGGMSSVGTLGSCDFTNVACQNPCDSLPQWQQADCGTYLTCMQSNSACVKASDAICATAGAYGTPTCADLYKLSGANDVLTTYMKCVCGLA